MNKKKHWETVYNTKTPQEVSWTQKYPKTSIEFIKSLKIDANNTTYFSKGQVNVIFSFQIYLKKV